MPAEHFLPDVYQGEKDDEYSVVLAIPKLRKSLHILNMDKYGLEDLLERCKKHEIQITQSPVGSAESVDSTASAQCRPISLSSIQDIQEQLRSQRKDKTLSKEVALEKVKVVEAANVQLQITLNELKKQQ